MFVQSFREEKLAVVRLPILQIAERIAVAFLLSAALCLASVVAFYIVVTRSPLHLIYDALEPAGPGSVYVQGGGFSGFWFQMGLLQSIPNLLDYEYYCYSSGCLALVVAFMDMSLEEGFHTASRSKDAWLDGHISRYEIVEHFMENLLNNTEIDEAILNRLNVLVTTSQEGVVARKATTVEDLKDAIIKTMYIPLVTGASLWPTDNNGTMYADGAFSQALHPDCEHVISVPATPETLLHLFNPNFEVDLAKKFWTEGQQYDHTLFAASI